MPSSTHTAMARVALALSAGAWLNLSAGSARAETDMGIPATRVSACSAAGVTAIAADPGHTDFALDLTVGEPEAPAPIVGAALEVELVERVGAGVDLAHVEFRARGGAWMPMDAILPCDADPACEGTSDTLIGDLPVGIELADASVIGLRLSGDVPLPAVRRVCVEAFVTPASDGPAPAMPDAGDPSDSGGCSAAGGPFGRDALLVALGLLGVALRRRSTPRPAQAGGAGP